MLIEINKNLYETIDTNYVNNRYIKNNKYFIDLKSEHIELFKVLGIIKIEGGVKNEVKRFV